MWKRKILHLNYYHFEKPVFNFGSIFNSGCSLGDTATFYVAHVSFKNRMNLYDRIASDLFGFCVTGC